MELACLKGGLLTLKKQMPLKLVKKKERKENKKKKKNHLFLPVSNAVRRLRDICISEQSNLLIDGMSCSSESRIHCVKRIWH